MKAATGEVVTAEELGGGDLHSRVSGVTDHLADDDAHALQIVRQIVGTLGPREPRPWDVDPVEEPLAPTRVDLRGRARRLRARPTTSARSSPGWSTAAGSPSSSRSTGRRWSPASPGCTATRSGSSPTTASCSPSRRSRARTSSSCATSAKIPLLFLQNITGFMVGRDYEAGGIAKHGAKMVTAVACARVPKLTVVIGGSFGAGNYSMCGRAYSPRVPVHLAQRPHLGDGRRAGRQRAGQGPPRRRSRPAARSGRPRTRRRSRSRSATSTSSRATPTTPPPGSGTTA